ncbi:PIR Superfamily Protein [Plasmodium ovale wallikeri]|uniref:PIR Superfamily Protein n=2 Tax=Plasmodium ovale TaxID=36330 RepID=A0A1A9ANU2_PLAOA|nr:PIR Superfamily Protein [Plasmodium ovale wallikeri]SBT58339.1 PIR Superfamily Protein [Plasmodium ovale wallikeri]SBT74564.1 Plasmodium vivax Vir protein, putative [Plasmodium ovale]
MTIKNKNLPNLPSYKAYDTYNSDKGVITCDTCCASVISLNNVYPGISNICESLAKNLNYIKEINQQDNLNYLYTYLFYWVHEAITNLNIEDLTSKYKDIMDLLHSECDNIKSVINISDNNICKSWKYDMGIDHINKKKAFIEFFDDYETMRNEIFPSDGGDCSKYFDYIIDIAKIYNQLDTICKPDNENCYEFYVNKEYPDPYVLLGFSSCSKIKESRGTSLDLNLLAFPGASPDSLLGLSPTESEQQANSSNFEYYHTITIVVLSFCGIILMLFLIYRLTPIGPWFYNQVFKKKLIRNYFNGEESQELLEHTSDSLDMNSQKMDYNLQYYPA